jgi:hypothetical protein
VKTTGGADAAKVDTQQGQTSVAKTQSGNYYADKDGTVYKKDASGGWSSNSGSGWQTVNKPTSQSASSATKPATTSTAAHPPSASGMSTESLESQQKAREYGSQQTQRTSQYQSAARYGGGRR